MSITEASPLPRRSTGSGPVATTRKLLSIARYARSRDYPSFFVHMTSVAPRLGYIRAPLQPFWVLSHPELVHEVLVTRGSVMEKGPTAGILNGLLGEGLVTAPRAIQRAQRRLIQPAFHRDRLRGYEDQMRVAGLELASQWRDGDVLTLDEEMSELTLRVVGRALFGDDLTDEVASVSGGPLGGARTDRRLGRGARFAALSVVATAGRATAAGSHHRTPRGRDIAGGIAPRAARLPRVRRERRPPRPAHRSASRPGTIGGVHRQPAHRRIAHLAAGRP